MPSGLGTPERAPALHEVVCTGSQADPTHLVFHQAHILKMAALKNNNNNSKTYKRVRCGAFSFFFFSDFSWAMGVTCERSRCCRRLLFITFSGILFLRSLPPAVFGRVKPQGLALAGGWWCGSHSSKRCPVAGQQLCICLWREEEQLCPYPREWIELKNLWDYFTLSPPVCYYLIALPFLNSFGGGW